VSEEVSKIKTDAFYMRLAIAAAKQGHYQTWKNPLVGAVIVKHGRVLATGYHKRYGEPHAERNAIAKLTPEQLFNSTLYVTLEPCNHFGKQPPCSDLVAASGIRRVVIAQVDPHQLVTGKGIAKLKQKGLDVTVGVLQAEASQLNPFYNYFYQHQRPWITIKEAVSLDNKAGLFQQRTQITNQLVYEQVHQERAEYQAIMIGSNTALIDNPHLNTSIASPFQPIKVIVDRRGRLLTHPALHLLNETGPVWLFTGNRQVKASAFHNQNLRISYLQTSKIAEVVKDLAAEEIQAVYVEGGPTLEAAIINAGLANELIKYEAPILLGQHGLTGLVPNEQLKLIKTSQQTFGDNIRITGEIKYV
jgi:diaminohydroxyphosphoribosylaminopyrimidine deaminase/5-amino-6-(5-phosphoribosylamino)uracil reductase